jgi:RNA polymerase sigma-70 factor (ECF subfamily)
LDRELVERAQRGDESAFAELVEHWGDWMYAVAYHILRDPGRADDAAQQAMIDIWRKLPTLRDPDRFQAWAHRVLARAAYAEAARRSRWLLRGRLGAVAESGARRDLAIDVAERDQLDRALDRLSVEHRAVIVLKHYAGFSNDEISRALDIPEGTVRSRLHYAHQAIRAEIDADRRPAIAPVEP